jgi:hypothetical protein
MLHLFENGIARNETITTFTILNIGEAAEAHSSILCVEKS